MGLFSQAEDITQIIKYEQPDNNENVNSIFIWKHPCEDFNTTTQLIVHESQEALFFMNGQALDLFGPGRHTLQTENIPLIKKAFNWLTNGETPFHCEVYFINLVEQMAIMWGTDSQVEYMDPVYHFPLAIGASGEMRLQVSDSRKLLVKLLGTEKELNRETLVRYFREILNMRIKSYIASVMGEENINIFDVDKYLERFSENLQNKLVKDFAEYGVALKKFVVSRIQKPEDRNFQRFKELHYASYMNVAEAELKKKIDLIEQETQTQKTILEAKGIAEKRRLEGYTYQDERGFDVAEKLVQNEAMGEFTNTGMGLGMMAGMGGGIGLKVADMASQAIGSAVPVSEPMTSVVQEKKLAQNDTPVAENLKGTTMENFESKVQKLKMLKDAGLISEERLNEETAKLMQLL